MRSTSWVMFTCNVNVAPREFKLCDSMRISANNSTRNLVTEISVYWHAIVRPCSVAAVYHCWRWSLSRSLTRLSINQPLICSGRRLFYRLSWIDRRPWRSYQIGQLAQFTWSIGAETAMISTCRGLLSFGWMRMQLGCREPLPHFLNTMKVLTNRNVMPVSDDLKCARPKPQVRSLKGMMRYQLHNSF